MDWPDVLGNARRVGILFRKLRYKLPVGAEGRHAFMCRGFVEPDRTALAGVTSKTGVDAFTNDGGQIARGAQRRDADARAPEHTSAQ